MQAASPYHYWWWRWRLGTAGSIQIKASSPWPQELWSGLGDWQSKHKHQCQQGRPEWWRQLQQWHRQSSRVGWWITLHNPTFWGKSFVLVMTQAHCCVCSRLIGLQGCKIRNCHQIITLFQMLSSQLLQRLMGNPLMTTRMICQNKTRTRMRR